ncbi:MAG TPA: tellurite resistance TerB family protein [Stellaceae bacterium]|jgi:hypothetical protein|nr:tellurite resistance TerB family protein [Stellaceae bacterium]
MLDPQGALIYTMALVTGAEARISATERNIIGDIVGHLPVFRGFDRGKLAGHLNDCAELLGKDDGLDEILDTIKAALPARLRETAYAIACDLIASDGSPTQEELQLLDLMRERFEIDRLITAAIERGTRARFQKI